MNVKSHQMTSLTLSNETMSDNEVVASDVPSRYLLNTQRLGAQFGWLAELD